MPARGVHTAVAAAAAADAVAEASCVRIRFSHPGCAAVAAGVLLGLPVAAPLCLHATVAL